MSRAIFLTILIALPACSLLDRRGVNDGVFAPSGVDRREESVDGLIVGHRLMAAGEHELALKAYLGSASERGLTVDVLSALGSANLKLGRLGQAETLLRRAVDMDPTFVPGLNNLGVVLMETGQIPEASRVFRAAFAADSGQSDAIPANLIRALAKVEDPNYADENNANFALVRRGGGFYLILSTS